MPDWDDNHPLFRDHSEEAWKPNATRDACKELYKQWQQVMFLLKGILLPILEKPEDSIEAAMDIDMARELHGDAYIVGVKICSSEAGNTYVLRMENAAIIRKLAQGIATGLLGFELADSAEESYINVVRDEIEKFRSLFKVWVDSFEKDDYTDEWGLFC